MLLTNRKATRRKVRAFAAGVCSLIVATMGVVAAAPPAAGGEPDRIRQSDWPSWTRDTVGSRHNAAEWKINPGTVGRLELKWAYTLGYVPYARVGSQPAVVNGVAYVGAPDAKFHALDAKTGATKWIFDLTTVTGNGDGMATNGVRDGAAVAGDKVYFGDGTGRVYAVYTRTGRLAWARQVSDHPETLMTSSPLVHDGRLYIGVSTGEGGTARDPNYPCCTHRGQVVALDTDTGQQVWTHYTVPQPREVGTWPSGAKMYAPSGGSVWSSPVIDPRSRTLFVGTGNNATGAAGDIDSVLAISIDTGRVKWRQRTTFPDTYTSACNGDSPDYCPGGENALDADFGASANVLNVNGRTLVTIAQKDGRLFAFDARTGAIVWQTRLAESDGHGSMGIEWGTSYDGRWIYGATWHSNPGRLFAIDPANGRIVWRTDHPADGCTTGGAAAYPDMCQLSFTPAVSTTPGLVYEGSSDGKIRIFSSRNGELLWEFDAIRDFDGVNGIPGRGSAISGNGGAVISDGMVYVQAGYYPFYPTEKGTVLLAFGL